MEDVSNERARIIQFGDLKESSVLLRRKTNAARFKRPAGYFDSSSSSEIDSRPEKQFATALKPKDKEQECLTKALQNYTQYLVEYLPFCESDIPDDLLDGCLTEDECSSVRKTSTRKDQIRQLLLLIKGRSFETIERFLIVIKPYCSETVENIWREYRTNLECQVSGRPTNPIEKLKSDVNIKYVVDVLWEKRIITDVLVHDITNCDRPAGDQDSLWKKLLQSCQESNKMHELCNALAERGHYHHIAKSILNELKRPDDGSTCRGRIKPNVPPITQNMTGVRDSATTYSPASSVCSTRRSLSEVSENEEETIQTESCLTNTIPNEEAIQIESSLTNKIPTSSEQSLEKHNKKLTKAKQKKHNCCHWPRFIFPCFHKVTV